MRTVIIHDSGIFKPGANSIPGMGLSKEALKSLHTAVIYILGRPTDIAYADGMDDFNLINSVPVMVANEDVGHGGTFCSPTVGLPLQ